MNPRNVEEVLMDFKGRRAGIIKALTKDVELFYNKSDPNHPSLSLYGLPNQRWEVNPSPLLPPPSELPEPRSGINTVRDATSKEEWLSMVALHSDAWLQAIASYFSAKCKFVQADRNRLFKKISDMSLISELILDGTTKRAKANYGTLPDEMLEQVLARLPVKDLLTYKFVCTKWRSIINDPDFVSNHLGSYKGNIAKNKLLVVMEGLNTWQNKDRVIVRCSDTFRKVKQLEKLDHMDRCHVLSYVNGLALVKNRVLSFHRVDVISWYHSGNCSSLREIILWNPSINKCIKVPRPEGIIGDLDLGLGFDASKNDYKLVLLVYPPTHFPGFDYVSNNQGGLVPGLVQVYTLSTNSWITKPNVHSPLRCLVWSQVFVNGTIHWMALGTGVVVDNSLSIINKDRMYIFTFEVVDEVFSDMEVPIRVVDVRNEAVFLRVMEGCLAMFCVTPLEHDIWVMKDYGNSNSWMKCYTFSLQYSKPLYFKGNGEFLYAKDGLGIKSYDVKKNRVRDLARTFCKTSNYMIYPYVESLVLSSLPARACTIER